MGREGCALLALPDDVLREILIRLPARCLCLVRLACKALFTVTSESTFLLDHANLMATASPIVLSWVVSSSTTYGMDNDHSMHVSIPRDPAAGDEDRRRLRCCDLLISTGSLSCGSTRMRSWDGVLIVETSVRAPPPPLSSFAEHVVVPCSYLLLNPLSRACAVVPGPAMRGVRGRCYDRGSVVGAYSHPGTGIFHLLHCSVTYSEYSTGGAGVGRTRTPCFRLLSVGAPGAAWREIKVSADADTEEARTTIGCLKLHSSATVHGNLHWRWPVVTTTCRGQQAKLLVYHTVKEEFGCMALPRLHGAGAASMARQRQQQQQTIGTMSGKLCLLAGVAPITTELWVLEDYEAQDSWRLRLMLHAEGSPLNWGYPLNCLGNVGVLVGSDGEVEEIVLHEWPRMFRIARDEGSWSQSELGNHRRVAIHRETLVPHHVVFGTAPPARGVVISISPR